MPPDATQQSLRDPDALARATWALAAVVVLWPLLLVAEFRPADLFDTRNLKVMGGFLGQFFPPNLNGEFLGLALRATVETLAMATAGIALAALLAARPSVADLTLTGNRIVSRNRAVALDFGGYLKGVALDRAAAELDFHPPAAFGIANVDHQIAIVRQARDVRIVIGEGDLTFALDADAAVLVGVAHVEFASAAVLNHR